MYEATLANLYVNARNVRESGDVRRSRGTFRRSFSSRTLKSELLRLRLTSRALCPSDDGEL